MPLAWAQNLWQLRVLVDQTRRWRLLQRQATTSTARRPGSTAPVRTPAGRRDHSDDRGDITFLACWAFSHLEGYEMLDKLLGKHFKHKPKAGAAGAETQDARRRRRSRGRLVDGAAADPINGGSAAGPATPPPHTTHPTDPLPDMASRRPVPFRREGHRGTRRRRGAGASNSCLPPADDDAADDRATVPTFASAVPGSLLKAERPAVR
jgi:hypothetical protein